MDFPSPTVNKNKIAYRNGGVDHGMYPVCFLCCIDEWIPLQFIQTWQRTKTGLPFIPFLFLLIAEALSRLLHKEKEVRLIKGVKVAIQTKVTHVLFMDDVLMFGVGTFSNIQNLEKGT